MTGESTKHYTINAGGFMAVADAFAREEVEESDDGHPADAHPKLWFVSMVGYQTSVKAIAAALVKNPPAIAHIEGGDLGDTYATAQVPYKTLGEWSTKIARLPVTGAYHAMVYPKLAEYDHDGTEFLLVGQDANLTDRYLRFLNRRTDLPLDDAWAPMLWEWGLVSGTVQQLESQGVSAYHCRVDAKDLADRISRAVAAGILTVGKAVAA